MQTHNVELLCHYHYDPLDRLITQAFPGESGQQRFYCKSRLATEIKGAIRYSIFQHQDQLLAQRRSDAGAVDITLLTTDKQRSVLHTLKANQQPQSIAYSSYGYCPGENGLTSLLGFNGERLDRVTGFYLLGNGHRGFDPVLMQFNSPDMLSPFRKGGLNPYAYCLRDPINNLDPSGNVPLPFRVQSMATKWLTKTRLNRPPGWRTIASATKPKNPVLAVDFEKLGKTNVKWSLADNSSAVSSERPVARVISQPTSAQNSTTNLANTRQRAVNGRVMSDAELIDTLRELGTTFFGALRRVRPLDVPPNLQASIRAAVAPIRQYDVTAPPALNRPHFPE